MDGDDDGALVGVTDSVKPWTIKSMPNEVRNMVVTAARDEGLTVSQWLERVIRERVATGRAPALASPAPPMVAPALGEVAQMMQAAIAAATAVAAGAPLPPTLAKDANATARMAMRVARGLPAKQASSKPDAPIQAQLSPPAPAAEA